jgi:hypothetical protein
MRSLKVFAVVGLAVSTLAGYALGKPTLEYDGRVIFNDVVYLQYTAKDNVHGIWKIISYKDSPPKVDKEAIMFEELSINAKPTDIISSSCKEGVKKEISFYIMENVARGIDLNHIHDHYIKIEGCGEDRDEAAFKLRMSDDPPKPLAALLPPVPSATEWGLIVLGFLLAGSLAFMIRRRLAPRPAGA